MNNRSSEWFTYCTCSVVNDCCKLKVVKIMYMCRLSSCTIHMYITCITSSYTIHMYNIIHVPSFKGTFVISQFVSFFCLAGRD